MAEGFLRSFDPTLDVHSAGTIPAARVHPKAVQVMKEVGIDLSQAVPESVDRFLIQSFDYLITVCDHAKEMCPVFSGKVKQRLHMGFDDPAEATGTEEEILIRFRRVQDEIRQQFRQFYLNNLHPDATATSF